MENINITGQLPPPEGGNLFVLIIKIEWEE